MRFIPTVNTVEPLTSSHPLEGDKRLLSTMTFDGLLTMMIKNGTYFRLLEPVNHGYDQTDVSLGKVHFTVSSFRTQSVISPAFLYPD